MKDKVILVDCDGVLLDWEYAFNSWMKRHGYEISDMNCYDMGTKYAIEKPESKKLIRMFNESAWIRRLPPLRDAIHYVKLLHERHGYIFHAITSLSDDPYSQHLRTKNLRELFGNTAFERYTYLDTGADKDEALAEYEGTNCYWVEDKPENADAGLKVGLDSILVAHNHNVEYNGDAKRMECWGDIYREIISA